MPEASFVLAAELTPRGHRGSATTPWRNDAVRAAIRIEPASAVPIAAPRFVAVFWRPRRPGSPRPARPTRSRPRAATRGRRSETHEQHWHRDESWRSPGRQRREQPEDAEQHRRFTPTRTIRRGDSVGRKRGIAIAASSKVIDSGMIRRRSRSRTGRGTTDRKSGIVKKTPPAPRYWRKKSPGRCSSAGSGTSTGARVGRHHGPPACVPAGGRARAARALQHEEHDRRSPRIDGAPAFGLAHHHSPERRRPKTNAPGHSRTAARRGCRCPRDAQGARPPTVGPAPGCRRP